MVQNWRWWHTPSTWEVGAGGARVQSHLALHAKFKLIPTYIRPCEHIHTYLYTYMHTYMHTRVHLYTNPLWYPLLHWWPSFLCPLTSYFFASNTSILFNPTFHLHPDSHRNRMGKRWDLACRLTHFTFMIWIVFLKLAANVIILQ